MAKNVRVNMATWIAGGLCCLLLASHPASASPANWSTGFLLQTEGGFVNPALLVAFNPQPEPPLWTGQTSLALVEGQAMLTINDVSNPPGGLQNFQFLLGIANNNGPIAITSIPANPVVDFRLGFSVVTGGPPISFWAIMDVVSSTGGIMAQGSAVMFNPQPEPPEFGLGGFQTYGLDFGVTQLSSVTLSMRIEDAAGNQLNLVPIPEPVGLAWLMLGALFGMPFFRTRNTGVTVATKT